MAANASLALLAALTRNGVPPAQDQQSVTCAALLAVSHVNTRNGSIVPELATDLSEDFRLRPLVYNTRANANAAIEAVVDYVEWLEGWYSPDTTTCASFQGVGPLAAIVGAWSSSQSIPSGRLSAVYELPQTSFGSSAATLSEAKRFPFFSRTYPSDVISANILYEWMAQYRWKACAILHALDEYATEYSEVLQSAAASNPTGMQVKAVQYFREGINGSINEAIGDIKRSDIKVVIFIVLKSADLERMVLTAGSLGSAPPLPKKDPPSDLYSPHAQALRCELFPMMAVAVLSEGYAWYGTDASSVAHFRELSSVASDYAVGLQTLSLYLPPKMDGFARLSTLWGGLSPADCSIPPSCKACVPFTPDASIFDRPPNDVGAFAYDAVVATALAMNAVGQTEGAPFASADVLRQLRGAHFEGASGYVSFYNSSSSNSSYRRELGPGDRAPGNLKYSIRNVVRSSDTGQVELVSAVYIEEINGSVHIEEYITPPNGCSGGLVWPGGGCDPPPPGPTDSDVSSAPFAVELVYGLVSGAAVLVLLLMWLLLRSAVRAVLRQRRIAAEHRYEAAQRVIAAVKSVKECRYPAAFVRLTDVERLGFITHEDARDKGVLTVIDTYTDLVDFTNRIPTVFCSHQWLGYKAPDPDGVQIRALAEGVRSICSRFSIDPEDIFLWVDYMSVPQANSSTQKVAISTLAVYASTCRYFLAVCPTTVHVDSGQVCDVHTYADRGWCRLEMWARLTVGGHGSKMLLYAGGNVRSLPEAEGDILKKAIHVFQGNFTVPSDRHALVDPVLGLWALALCGHDDRTKELYDRVQEDHEHIFPEDLHISEHIMFLEHALQTPNAQMEHNWATSTTTGLRAALDACRRSVARRLPQIAGLGGTVDVAADERSITSLESKVVTEVHAGAEERGWAVAPTCGHSPVARGHGVSRGSASPDVGDSQASTSKRAEPGATERRRADQSAPCAESTAPKSVRPPVNSRSSRSSLKSLVASVEHSVEGVGEAIGGGLSRWWHAIKPQAGHQADKHRVGTHLHPEHSQKLDALVGYLERHSSAIPRVSQTFASSRSILRQSPSSLGERSERIGAFSTVAESRSSAEDRSCSRGAIRHVSAAPNGAESQRQSGSCSSASIELADKVPEDTHVC